jgi:hypothetical protein
MSAEYAKFSGSSKSVLAVKMGCWTIPVINGVTCNKIATAFRRLGIVLICDDDLDTEVTINDRDSFKIGSYIVSFVGNVDADKNFKNFSANMLAEKKVNGITLRERMLLGFGCLLTTGNHLDSKRSITLCSGSRYSNGSVPIMYWDTGGCEMYIGHYDPGKKDDPLVRTRAVVKTTILSI